jgi:hypothetical protein
MFLIVFNIMCRVRGIFVIFRQFGFKSASFPVYNGNVRKGYTVDNNIEDNIICNILAYTVRFKERVTREPNFSSSQKRVSRDNSLNPSLKRKCHEIIV